MPHLRTNYLGDEIHRSGIKAQMETLWHQQAMQSWVRLGIDPCQHCLGISEYGLHHPNTKEEMPGLWRRYQRGSANKMKKWYMVQKYTVKSITNHKNSKQWKVFNLIYLLFGPVACLPQGEDSNEKYFIFFFKKENGFWVSYFSGKSQRPQALYKFSAVYFGSRALLQWYSICKRGPVGWKLISPSSTMDNHTKTYQFFILAQCIYSWTGFEIWMYFCYCKNFEGWYSLTSEPGAPKQITEHF